jgi:tetratricopeptide (TPR) repeat protein
MILSTACGGKTDATPTPFLIDIEAKVKIVLTAAPMLAPTPVPELAPTETPIASTPSATLDMVGIWSVLTTASNYSKNNDWEKAFVELNKAKNLDTQNAWDYEINFYFAETYANLGNWEQALHHFNNVIQHYPKNAVAHRLRGMGYAIAYSERGAVYQRLESYELAIEDFNKAIRIDPEYAQSYFNRGILYEIVFGNTEAIVDYTEAIRLEPEYAKAYYNRGNCFFRMEEFEYALSDYTEVIRIDPEYANAYYNRGLIHEIVFGNQIQAVQDFAKAKELELD